MKYNYNLKIVWIKKNKRRVKKINIKLYLGNKLQKLAL